MSTVAYVTDAGSVRQPAARDRQIGWWWAATTSGLSLGNYARMDGSTAFVVQDRCQPDRATLGLSPREWAAWVQADRDRYWT